MTTATQDYRRRTVRDLANRPTKQLLKDRAYLAGLLASGEATPERAAQLHETERELGRRTSGLAKKVRHA